MARLFVFFVLFFNFWVNCSAQVYAKKGMEASRVILGLYPVSLHDFNYAKNTFSTSFYAWSRTKDTDYRPKLSLEVANAVSYTSKNEIIGKNQDEQFTTLRFDATIAHHWNIQHFPFDRQILKIIFEDAADIHDVIFQPDTEHSRLHPEIKLPGWKTIRTALDSSVNKYETNFGDSSVDQANYSRVSFEIEIKRQGLRLFFNYFIGFIVAFFICFLTYFIEPENLTARGSFLLGALFTSIGNKYVVDNFLPLTDQFSLNDAIQFSTFGMIIASVSVTILPLFLLKKHPSIKLKELNHGIGFGAGFVFLLFILLHIATSVLS